MDSKSLAVRWKHCETAQCTNHNRLNQDIFPDRVKKKNPKTVPPHIILLQKQNHPSHTLLTDLLKGLLTFSGAILTHTSIIYTVLSIRAVGGEERRAEQSQAKVSQFIVPNRISAWAAFNDGTWAERLGSESKTSTTAAVNSKFLKHTESLIIYLIQFAAPFSFKSLLWVCLESSYNYDGSSRRSAATESLLFSLLASDRQLGLFLRWLNLLSYINTFGWFFFSCVDWRWHNRKADLDSEHGVQLIMELNNGYSAAAKKAEWPPSLSPAFFSLESHSLLPSCLSSVLPPQKALFPLI